jgi:hypothetical protein
VQHMLGVFEPSHVLQPSSNKLSRAHMAKSKFVTNGEK